MIVTRQTNNRSKSNQAHYSNCYTIHTIQKYQTLMKPNIHFSDNLQKWNTNSIKEDEQEP